MRFFRDRILTYKDNDQYIAVSLEFDLFAEGKSSGQALERLVDATMGYLQVCVEDNEKNENIYRPAPQKYQKMFALNEEIGKILSRKTAKGTLERKAQNLIKKEAQGTCKTYDARNLVYA